MKKCEISRLDEVHAILVDFYDEEYQKNELNAKKNYSKIIRILKERIEGIKR